MSIIKVQNLTKKFNDLVAVDSISFDVEAGEVFAFLGPNGAGKTTTIKMMTTIAKPTAGRIELNGYDITQNPDEARQSFGIVFQDSSLDEELTAYENMELHGVLYSVPKETRKTRIKQLLDIVELWDRRQDFVKNFSGGMRRRLEIARGLLHHPKVLFLDEPTLGLDPQTRAHIWAYIKKLNQEEKVTVFLTTHYMDEVEKMADEIAIIDQGKIITNGTVAQLKKKTKTNSLEEAFIKLTGRKIREEEISSQERMRIRNNQHTRRH